MTVSSSTNILIIPLGSGGLRNPREPHALWRSFRNDAGDVSGGVINQDHYLKAANINPAGLMYDIQGVFPEANNAAQTACEILLAGFDELIGGAGPSIYQVAALGTGPNVQAGQGFASHGFRAIYPFRPRSYATTLYMRFTFTSNVNGADYNSYCWGFIWDPEVLIHGGPIRPPGF